MAVGRRRRIVCHSHAVGGVRVGRVGGGGGDCPPLHDPAGTGDTTDAGLLRIRLHRKLGTRLRVGTGADIVGHCRHAGAALAAGRCAAGMRGAGKFSGGVRGGDGSNVWHPVLDRSSRLSGGTDTRLLHVDRLPSARPARRMVLPAPARQPSRPIPTVRARTRTAPDLALQRRQPDRGLTSIYAGEHADRRGRNSDHRSRGAGRFGLAPLGRKPVDRGGGYGPAVGAAGTRVRLRRRSSCDNCPSPRPSSRYWSPVRGRVGGSWPWSAPCRRRRSPA